MTKNVKCYFKKNKIKPMYDVLNFYFKFNTNT